MFSPCTIQTSRLPPPCPNLAAFTQPQPQPSPSPSPLLQPPPQVQRSQVPKDGPNANLWVLTTTMPARLSFYNQAPYDWVRLALEIILLLLLIQHSWGIFRQCR